MDATLPALCCGFSHAPSCRYKRQLLNALAIIKRYQDLKKASPEERATFVRKTVLFAGKAAPGCVGPICSFVFLVTLCAKILQCQVHHQAHLRHCGSGERRCRDQPLLEGDFATYLCL
jgi:hypothetical protein